MPKTLERANETGFMDGNLAAGGRLRHAVRDRDAQWHPARGALVLPALYWLYGERTVVREPQNDLESVQPATAPMSVMAT